MMSNNKMNTTLSNFNTKVSSKLKDSSKIIHRLESKDNKDSMPILEYKQKMRDYIDDKDKPNLNQSFTSNSSMLNRRQKINSIKNNLKNSHNKTQKVNQENLSLNKFEYLYR